MNTNKKTFKDGHNRLPENKNIKRWWDQEFPLSLHEAIHIIKKCVKT
jgi:hypothetical protein